MNLNLNVSESHKPDLEAKPSFAVRTATRSFDETGMCVDCKEYCDLGASCCGRGVYFEGGFVADHECDCSWGIDGATPELCEHCAKESA